MTALPPLTAFAPLLLLGVAALSLSMSGRRPGLLPKLAEGATLGAGVLTGSIIDDDTPGSGSVMGQWHCRCRKCR